MSFQRSWSLAVPISLSLVLLMAFVAPVQAQNLLINGDFDSDLESWENPSTSVTIVHVNDQGSDLDGASGPGAMEVQHFFWNGGADGPGQLVSPVVPGVSYTISGSYLLPTADNVADSVSILVTWRDSDGLSLSSEWLSAFPLLTDTWDPLEATMTAPADAATAYVRLMVGNPILSGETRPGVTLFDDLWFQEMGATTATQVLFVPVAASATGAAGTFWSTNGWFSNLVGFPVKLSGALLHQGGDNSSALAQLTELGTVPAFGHLLIQDMVAALGASEVAGGIYLVASAEADGLPAVLVTGTTHTFTPNPLASGGYGQGLPASAAGTKNEVVVPGVYQGGAFRTNIGVLNTSDQAIAVDIVVRDGAGSEVAGFTWNLAPYEQKQKTLPSQGVTGLNGGTVVFRSTSQGASMLAYSSVVDQNSGDAVYIEAR